MFHYLNAKSVVLWKIWGEGGWLHSASFEHSSVTYIIAGIKLILSGNWKELTYKIHKKVVSPITSRYANSRNVGS